MKFRDIQISFKMLRLWQYLLAFGFLVFINGGCILAENVTDGLAFNFTLPLIWDGVKPPQLPMDTEME
jgi:hypothetical protein